MILSTLDPRAALVVVDLQKGVIGLPTAHPTADVVARSAELARRSAARTPWSSSSTSPAAHRAGPRPAPRRAPRPPDGADLDPELDAQPSDIRVTKATRGEPSTAPTSTRAVPGTPA